MIRIDQSAEEVEEAMRDDPKTWAEMFIEQQKRIDALTEIVETVNADLLGSVPVGGVH